MITGERYEGWLLLAAGFTLPVQLELAEHLQHLENDHSKHPWGLFVPNTLEILGNDFLAQDGD